MINMLIIYFLIQLSATIKGVESSWRDLTPTRDLCSSNSKRLINDEIRESLCPNKDEKTKVVLYFDEKAKLSDLHLGLTLSRPEKRLEVKKYLYAHSSRVQACLVKSLGEKKLDFKSFWIVNAIEVKSINLAELQNLMESCPFNPFFIDKNHQHQRVISPKEKRSAEETSSLAWNIEKINADKVWAMGIKGNNITIATIDGGVNYEHVALKYNYRGATVNGKNIEYTHDYNWNDWAYGDEEPSDNEGHGTNVAGVASGTQDSGVGVAVESKWMAAKIFNYAGYCEDTWIIEATQWVMCPTPVNDLDGVERCDLGADIVSCSWGGITAKSPDSEQYINAWTKAGMLPVYAVGNSGPECNSVVAPATIAGVIGVGGTDKYDEVVSWSARGPGPSSASYNINTPALVAPGLSIYGPACDDTSSYVGMSGTSQATPHVAGVAALMLSAVPDASVEDLTKVLLETAAKDTLREPSDGQLSCGGKAWNDFESGSNYIYGSGRLDALAAVNAFLNHQAKK